jgi:5,10-methylenetetrahydromethanopterin reductase
MRTGIFGGDVGSRHGGFEDLIAAARSAADDGFTTFWLPQVFGIDALAALAVVGREVPGIELGTAVVPTYPRHPMVMASQALTTQAATDGRLVLGIGLSHQVVIESMFGYSFSKPVRHMREYLTVLNPLLRGEPVQFQGETVTFNGSLSIGPDASGQPTAAPPVLVAALGTQMLRVTAKLADGTITWMTGHATLREHTVPTITSAARESGRPTPRIAAGLPVCVTDDIAGARERAAKAFKIYGTLPSYRAMLDREGAGGPADVAIVGDEATVRAGLAQVADAGVHDFLAVEFGSQDDRKRTREVLLSVAD